MDLRIPRALFQSTSLVFVFCCIILQPSRAQTVFQEGSGANSVQVGVNPTASGADSIAIGTDSTANNTDAISVGGSTSSGVGSVAVGQGSSSSGGDSVAIGGQASATNTDSVAIGGNASAGGANAYHWVNLIPFLSAQAPELPRRRRLGLEHPLTQPLFQGV